MYFVCDRLCMCTCTLFTYYNYCHGNSICDCQIAYLLVELFFFLSLSNPKFLPIYNLLYTFVS